MGTQGVHNKKVLPWLVRLARRAGTIQEIFVLPWLLYSRPSTKYLFPHRNLFHFIFPIVQQAGQAGSRAASPVSSYVSHWFLENDVLMNCNLPVAPIDGFKYTSYVSFWRKLFIRRDFEKR